MSDYEKTIRSLTEVKPLASHMTSLGKIMAGTHDAQLYGLISGAIVAFQYQHQHSVSKSTPTSLMIYPIPQTIALSNYCRQFIGLKKPEWQILAERHGWRPPASG